MIDAASEPAARLGQTEGGDHLARCELGHVARLLFVVAEQEQAAHADRAVRADGDRHRGVVLRDLLQRARVGAAAEAKAAVLFGDHEAEQADGLQLFDELGRKLTCAVPVAKVRLVRLEHLREHAEHALQGFLFGAGDGRERQNHVLFDLTHAQGPHEADRLLIDHENLLLSSHNMRAPTKSCNLEISGL